MSDTYPLTAPQRGMWFAQQLDTHNAIFAGAQCIELTGPLDRELLVRAIAAAVDCETLNVRFVDDGGEPRLQRTSPDGHVGFVDLSALPLDEARAEAEAWMRAEMTRVLELRTGAAYSNTLVRLGDQLHLWFQRGHHAVSDGFSSALFVGVAARLYTAFVNGQGDVDPGYATLDELLADDAAYASGAQYTLDRDFWTERLAGVVGRGVTGLSAASAPPAHTFHRHVVEVGADVKRAGDDLARGARTTSSVVMCAAMALYVSRVRRTREVVLALPVAARSGALMRRTPSMMANVLPLVVEVDPARTARELVRHVADEIKRALKHQRYRFEDMRRDLRLGDGARLFGPGVDVLRFQDELRFGAASAEIRILSNGPVEDLNLAVYSGASIAGLRLATDANPDRYTAAETAAHGELYAATLASLVTADADTPVGRLDLLDAAGLERTVRVGTGATTEPTPPSWVERFDATAAAHPERTAVRCDGVELTYGELGTAADRLADVLADRGVGVESVVALALPRRPQLLTVLVAVARTGAAYLPLDPAHPAERLRVVLDEAAPTLIVTDGGLHERLPDPHDGRLLRLDDPAGPGVAAPRTRRADAPADRAAYVMYTSGSTGRPKGVCVTHRGLAHLVDWVIGPDGPVDVAAGPVVATTSLAFDPSVLELLAPLAAGGCVDLRPSPTAIADGDVRGAFAFTIPSVFSALAADGPLHLDVATVAVAGEAVTPEIARAVSAAAPGARLANLYGPTEVTVYATAAYGGPGQAPPIGAALPDTGLLVLDDCLRPLPDDVTGELYVTGVKLARGYHRRPTLTAERFVADPFAGGGRRMYRTGDLVSRRPDGVLDYRGRADAQVKIRGNRVELSEVEAVLAALPGVTLAAVRADTDGAGRLRLLGYVTGPGVDAVTVRDALAARVPAYMVPAVITVLDAMPLTATGKIDRAALPSVVVERRRQTRAPRSADEATLCALLADLLDLPTVGIDDDFFELGGNSLLATRLTARIRAALGVEVDLRTVFDRPTVAQLTDTLPTGADTRGSAPARPALRPRSGLQ